MSSAGQFGRDYGLRDQIQRASVSVVANIAEGYDSLSNREFVRFLGYALRSATEVQSHLYVALDQDYASQDQFNAIYQQAIEVKNLLHGFLRYLRKSEVNGANIEHRT
jgi:four helix bundle protein